MKRYYLLLFSLIAVVGIFAQEVVSSQGDSYNNTNLNIDFTIGEVVTETQSDGTNTLTQGFHQSTLNIVGIENFALDYEANIFPNPTEQILNIETTKFKNVRYGLFDALGKLVLQGELNATQTSLAVENLASGAYTLTLQNKKQKLISFKLIKTSK